MNDTTQKAPDEKYCGDCGAIIKRNAEICPKCGVRQFAPPPTPVTLQLGDRNKLAAALLAIFLGSFGAHKFYLGRVGLGILYLCFFWTGIPALVGFIEGIIYLVMSEADFAAKYRPA